MLKAIFQEWNVFNFAGIIKWMNIFFSSHACWHVESEVKKITIPVKHWIYCANLCHYRHLNLSFQEPTYLYNTFKLLFIIYIFSSPFKNNNIYIDVLFITLYTHAPTRAIKILVRILYTHLIYHRKNIIIKYMY